jgi:hypothetical protein
MDLEASDYIAAGALLVACVSLVVSILRQRGQPVEAVIEGLRGDRRAVTYAAQTIRLAEFLKRQTYRRSLIASLLLAWNFERSDRARAAVLAALVQAKIDYPEVYRRVLDDLNQRFSVYEQVVVDGQMERGQRRLLEVTNAVDRAVRVGR